MDDNKIKNNDHLKKLEQKKDQKLEENLEFKHNNNYHERTTK